MIKSNSSKQPPPLEIFIEVAPDGACFGHIPALPGLCFKANNPDELHRIASNEIMAYVGWLIREDLDDINPLATDITACFRSAPKYDFQLIERERLKGAPLWISGNPAVLFEADKRILNDMEVRAHLRVVRQVMKQIAQMANSLDLMQRIEKPATNRRSLNETLGHIGNCIWWYCSRINDLLPEPDEFPNEEPVDRAERLLKTAFEFLLAVPSASRSKIYIPRRFPTKDPNEPWNHTKVCRRQAEHVWEHLQAFVKEGKISD